MNSQIQVEIWRLQAYLNQNPTVASGIAVKYKTDYLSLKNKYKFLVTEIDWLIKEMSLPENSLTEYEAKQFPTNCGLTVEQEFDLEQFKRSLKFSNNEQSKIIAIDYLKRFLALNIKYQNQKDRFLFLQKALKKIDKSK